MKCFVFTNWQTAEVFQLLWEQYADDLAAMLRDAKAHAAKALPEDRFPISFPGLSEADGQVCCHLAEKLEAFVQNEQSGFCPEPDEDAFSMIFTDAMKIVDYLCIAKAVVQGVEPRSCGNRLHLSATDVASLRSCSA